MMASGVDHAVEGDEGRLVVASSTGIADEGGNSDMGVQW